MLIVWSLQRYFNIQAPQLMWIFCKISLCQPNHDGSGLTSSWHHWTSHKPVVNQESFTRCQLSKKTLFLIFFIHFAFSFKNHNAWSNVLMPEKTKRKKNGGGGEEVSDNAFSLLISVKNYKFYPDEFVHHNVASAHYY